MTRHIFSDIDFVGFIFISLVKVLVINVSDILYFQVSDGWIMITSETLMITNLFLSFPMLPFVPLLPFGHQPVPHVLLFYGR